MSCRTHAHVMDGKRHVYHPEKCIGCGNCVIACKKSAIGMVENTTYRPPHKSYRSLIMQMLPPVVMMGLGIKIRRVFSRS